MKYSSVTERGRDRSKAPNKEKMSLLVVLGLRNVVKHDKIRYALKINLQKTINKRSRVDQKIKIS